jgi:hypothetical protein
MYADEEFVDSTSKHSLKKLQTYKLYLVQILSYHHNAYTAPEVMR